MTGLGGMLKDGTQHMSGLEEAVLRNTEACRQLAQVLRTSLGPNGAWRRVHGGGARWGVFRVESQRAIPRAEARALA